MIYPVPNQMADTSDRHYSCIEILWGEREASINWDRTHWERSTFVMRMQTAELGSAI